MPLVVILYLFQRSVERVLVVGKRLPLLDVVSRRFSAHSNAPVVDGDDATVHYPEAVALWLGWDRATIVRHQIRAEVEAIDLLITEWRRPRHDDEPAARKVKHNRAELWPSELRVVNSRDRQYAEIAILKQAAKYAAGVVCDDNRVRFGERLKPCRKIRRLTNDRLFLGGALTEQITDDYEAGGDTDTHLQRGRLARIELGHGLEQGEARAHRLFGVLLMCLRVTEISQHADLDTWQQSRRSR